MDHRWVISDEEYQRVLDAWDRYYIEAMEGGVSTLPVERKSVCCSICVAYQITQKDYKPREGDEQMEGLKKEIRRKWDEESRADMTEQLRELAQVYRDNKDKLDAERDDATHLLVHAMRRYLTLFDEYVVLDEKIKKLFTSYDIANKDGKDE